MASPAKTSSSSIPYRTNPNMKKSELCDPMRRSFSGNPFTKPSVITNPRALNPDTPANSPSDFARRHSTGRESLASLRDRDKENSGDQNPKPTRVRSPAPSKGTKNFMSPTISAASKINASPRKKILVERNDPVRSSVSLSEVKSLIMEDKESTPDIALKQKKVSFSDVKSIIMEDKESTPEIALKQKKVSFSDVKSVIMENDPTLEIGLNQKKVSFSDVKSLITEDKESTPRIDLKQENVQIPQDSESINHECEDPLIGNADFDYKETKDDSDWLPETVTEEKDSVNVDPSFKISPTVSISPSCPVLTTLDADPLMLPYDPKTNYLSPRPQFLHYRPNPRIVLYREREGKQLDERFASESNWYSDTDLIEETQSEGSQAELEDISLEETMKAGEEEKEKLHVSELNSIAPDIAEEKFEAKRLSKPRFPTRSKFIALLLFLAFAYFLFIVANSPAFTPLGLEELSLSGFQVPTEVTEFAKANFDRFTENLQHWSASFLSYVSNIISSSREVHKVGPLQYANLSDLIEDYRREEHLRFYQSILGPVKERDSETEQFKDKYYREIEADELVDEDDEQELEEQENHDNSAYGNLEQISAEEPDEVQLRVETEMIELDHLEADENKGVEFAAQNDAEHQRNVDLRDNPSIMLQAAEIQHDKSETEGPEVEDANNIAETVFPKEEVKSDNLKIEDSTDNSQSSIIVDSTINRQEDQFLAKNVMGFSSLVFCLFAALAFMYTKRGKPSMPNASVPVKQPAVGKKSEYSPVSGSKDAIHERLSSMNYQTEVEVTNESCSSEMSSCLRTSSYQSQERRRTRKTYYRRESLASSDYSTGSPSYGSFTTYEKIPSKHGGEDEEIITPVRRSSRIRSQVTSP